MHVRRLIGAGVSAILVAFGTLAVNTQNKALGEWRSFGGDKGYTRYSLLDQINKDNVAKLQVVWRRPALDAQFTSGYPDLSPSPYFRSTPIMVDGVLFAPNAVGLIEAFDGGSGKTVWVQEPAEKSLQAVAGQSMRGVDYWASGRDQRIVVVRGTNLLTLDPKTGRTYADFGEHGMTNLKREELYAGPAFRETSGPIVVGDVVVIAGNGGGGGDLGIKKEAAPEDVRGYDVRTGKLRWTFHVRPRPGEFGADTWGDALDWSGDMGAWGALTADEELGYVYVPLTAPTNAMYGGHRPGQNLYSNALVCIDAKTGKRVWHYQMVHHDLWDYDNVGAPVLGDITVNGKRIKAVMQVNKTAFLYVFDRVTGEPVWPIEERPVPQSDVPGEHTWPTQPFPTKPPAFDRQGLTEDDLIDFTPELRAEALKVARRYVLGPMFTPPSLVGDGPGGKQGTIVMPGTWGAANWNTPAFDPETGIFYAASNTIPYINDLAVPADPKATIKYALKQLPGPPPPQPAATPAGAPPLAGPGTVQGPFGPTTTAGQNRSDRLQRIHEPMLENGLPIYKPPYGRLTAIDLNRGEIVWQVANGDGPRNHPALKNLNLPPLGTAGRPAPLVTKTLLFIGEGSDAIPGVPKDAFGNTFRAYDKATGKVIWQTELPAGTTGAPMTYLLKGRQYIVVPIGGKNHPPEFVALGLPETGPPTK
jgi:quinoprotein glucose dehydrogenase